MPSVWPSCDVVTLTLEHRIVYMHLFILKEDILYISKSVYGGGSEYCSCASNFAVYVKSLALR